MTTAVFIFYTDTWQALAGIVLPVAARYCKRHGYVLCDTYMKVDGFAHQLTDGSIPLPVGYHKMKALRYLLSKYHLIWVLDCDALITNEAIPFTNFLNEDADVYFSNDVHGLNAGSWVVRSNIHTYDWVSFIIKVWEDANDEQVVIRKHINCLPQLSTLPHPSINSYLYSEYLPEWNEKVGEGIEMPTHEGGNWEPGDLCLHLPGLTLERRVEVFTEIIKTL